MFSHILVSFSVFTSSVTQGRGDFSTSGKLGVCGSDWVESLVEPCCLL